MRKILAQSSVIIQAPIEACFDKYLDLASYPLWEPNTMSATVLNQGQEGRILRVAFHVGRRVLGIPILDLQYTLRCEHHWIPGGGFWIKFDEVKGDLDHVMTIIQIQPHLQDDGSTASRVRYRAVVGAHYPLKLALLSPFTDQAVYRHLLAFRGWVHETHSVEAPALEAAVG